MSKWYWLLIIILSLFLGYIIYKLINKYITDCDLESKAIYPDEAKALLKTDYFDYIIDVRTTDEWNTGHYPNAIHIGMERLIFDLPKTVPNLLNKILFYCAKGRRAKGASAIAKTLGYNNTRYLVGTYTDL